jgi:hypothetical protein
MSEERYTLKQAEEKFGKARKIFDIQIRDKLYPVYSIEGYEHGLGKWNGCPTTWWLDYSIYHTELILSEQPTLRELIPYIDKGVHRVCWGVDYQQHNSTKYKWGGWDIRSGGICKITANGKPVYKFHYRDLNGALAAASCKIDEMMYHPFDFINPENEIGRKIWYHGLPAKVLLGYEVGEIRIEPDYSYLSKENWWDELERRKTKIENTNQVIEDDDDKRIDKEHFEETKDYGIINHGDVFYDGMINWFRKD